MYRTITWTATAATTYTATVWVPDEWLGEGEVAHLDTLVAPVEHAGHAEGSSLTRRFVESHPAAVPGVDGGP